MNRFELLAPGGDVDCIKAALVAGADAIYCGLERFNARNRAVNITFEDLGGILRLAHQYDAQVFLTLNILIVESEISALITLLNKLVNTTIDGVIVQDVGLFYLLATFFPSLHIHASTQLTTHNSGQLSFLKTLHATRVNLSRELSVAEIQSLTTVAHAKHLLVEVFVHGSLCIGFSGLCYMSSVKNGNSGNRGRCSQPCRDAYHKTDQKKIFPLNLKDNAAYTHLHLLAGAGVDSFKIEGRIKKSHYVYTVVHAYKKQLDLIGDESFLKCSNSDIYTVFNRDFSTGFFDGNISCEMFIDNPRDHSAIHLAKSYGGCTGDNVEKAKQVLYDTKTKIINGVNSKIAPLTLEKYPLDISISGVAGERLQVVIKTAATSFTVCSSQALVPKKKEGAGQHLGVELFTTRFKAINETDFHIARMDVGHLAPNLFIPFKELTTIRDEILFVLHGSKHSIQPVDIPALPKSTPLGSPANLLVLIDSADDLPLCLTENADVYFEIPSQPDHNLDRLFQENPQLIPWFPAILIEEEYRHAVEFLERVQPKTIVTNNLGVAHVAFMKGIDWVAGPYLNTVNSYSLLCLQEKFNCSGAFIANEISKNQMRKVKSPHDFKLYFSIYHPIMLMTSRQCLFQQVTGCHKKKIDETCIGQCARTVTISNEKNGSFILHKSKGNYHSIYNEVHYLNTDVVRDSDLFSGFLVDLRRIPTDTQVKLETSRLMQLFAKHIAQDKTATTQLRTALTPVTNRQYLKGI